MALELYDPLAGVVGALALLGGLAVAAAAVWATPYALSALVHALVFWWIVVVVDRPHIVRRARARYPRCWPLAVLVVVVVYPPFYGLHAWWRGYPRIDLWGGVWFPPFRGVRDPRASRFGAEEGSTPLP